MNILDIEVPLIAAVNGPARLHSEYRPCSPTSCMATLGRLFSRTNRTSNSGIVPGDGVHLLWQEVIGSVRGRYFILTRQELDAETAKEWGAVNEIVPANRAASPCPRDCRRTRQAAAPHHEIHAHRTDPKTAAHQSTKASHSGSHWNGIIQRQPMLARTSKT